FGLMLDDMARLYAAEPAPCAPSSLDRMKRNPGTDAESAPAASDESGPLRYRAFAVWARSAEHEEWIGRQREYWLNQLRPKGNALPAIAHFPQDFPRPATPGGEGASITRLLPLPIAQLHGWLKQQLA